MSKHRIRQQIRELKITAKIKLKRSRKLKRLLKRTSFFKAAKTIGFYAALPDEIDLFPLIRSAFKQRKKVYLPCTAGRGLVYFEIRDLKKDLVPGKYGILEPRRKKKRKRTSALDLIFVPGRAFDKKGNRLGRGLGFYDRLLAKWPQSKRVGVAFREQLLKKIPSEGHDVRMHAVITA